MILNSKKVETININGNKAQWPAAGKESFH